MGEIGSRHGSRRAVMLTGVCLAALASGSARAADTVTPIKHLIVVFQENIAFDHYFGTYPNALNRPGEPAFRATPGTPTVSGLTAALLTRNPNKANPQRLGRDKAATCDMDHGYTAEQQAFDGGLMDKFVEFTAAHDAGCNRDEVMNYFDGNTVTALWNYAQHFAMSDNSFGTGFGPSTPGALNLVAGDTHGAEPAELKEGEEAAVVAGTVVGDPDPQLDDCSNPKAGLVALAGRNVGDLLNAKGVTWGWFQGGFRPTDTKDGRAVCGTKSTNIAGKPVTDYSPHHEPFQYWKQTANSHHLAPSSPDIVGKDDQANHQYDLSDFYTALSNGHMPEVSFVKAKKYQDGHAGISYSNPLDEQAFLVEVVNAVEKSPDWKDSAIIIAYDDSDGWYDHVMPPIVNGSQEDGLDALNGRGRCGNRPAAGGYAGRCGYGPRLPLLVISPYARPNFVDHTLTDQTSILRFVEDNWGLGRIGDHSLDELAGPLDGMLDFANGGGTKAVTLDPKTGEVAGGKEASAD